VAVAQADLCRSAAAIGDGLRCRVGALVGAKVSVPVGAAGGAPVGAAGGAPVRAEAGPPVRAEAGLLVPAEGGAPVRAGAGPLVPAEVGALVRAEDRDGLRCRAEARDTYGLRLGADSRSAVTRMLAQACPAASGVRTPRGSGRRDHRQRCSSRTLGAAVDQPAPQDGHRAGYPRKWPRMTRPRRGGAFIRAGAPAAAAAAGRGRRSRRWR